ncbi:MAG: hypothetical protein EG826_01150 [Deltaproteobacteria bacterium]|nr:hypothetical protein [Deltaproteobacteria bacterium]
MPDEKQRVLRKKLEMKDTVVITKCNSQSMSWNRTLICSRNEKPGADRSSDKAVTVSGPHALLIDEVQVLQDVTGGILPYIGYAVLTAQSHGDAMENYRQAQEANKPFSSLMTDWVLRGDEGGKSRSAGGKNIRT